MRQLVHNISTAREGRTGTLLLLTLLSLLAITPLFAPGYFYSAHDGRHSVFYLIQFDASIRDGDLWPRWAMHHTQGYGYPTFIIQAPLGFYLGELFVLLGAGYTLAAKLSWTVGSILSGWGMFFLVLHWLTPAKGKGGNSQRFESTTQIAALVSALIYVFVPYHLLGMYVRAALNDSLLLAWFPWVLLAFDRLILNGYSQGWQQRLAIAALCLGGTLLTHTFALISFTPFLISFVIFRLGFIVWRTTNPRDLAGRGLLAASAGVAALLLYANFLLPLLLEGSPNLQEQVYVSNTYDFRRHFVFWNQFVDPSWGFGYSDDPEGASDGMSFQAGILPLLIGVIALFQLRQMARIAGASLAVNRQDAGSLDHDRLALTLYLATVSFGLLFLMTPSAAKVWESLEFLHFIQFPWRLLALSSLSMSALAGVVLYSLGEQDRQDPAATSGLNASHERDTGLIIVALLVIFASFPYIRATLEPIEPWREDGRAIVFFEHAHPDMMGYTKWVTEPFTESPMTPNYLDESYGEDGENIAILDRIAIVAGTGKILSRYSRGSSAGGVVEADGPVTVQIRVYHFPGWEVSINGKPSEHSISVPEGLIEIDLPAGTHSVDARMKATTVRRVGSTISGIALILLLGLMFWKGKTD